VESIEAARRTSEIEEITNRHFIHPLASRLVPVFAWLGIAPNAVSLIGMAFGIAAGFAYYHFEDRRYTVAGFALMIAWHVMDGADGQLARLTGRQSELGRVLDGMCDYVTFIVVYAALAMAVSPRFGAGVWVLAIAAGFCHALQSAAYETQRQAYEFWAWGRGSGGQASPGARPGGFFGLLGRLYDGVQARLAAVPPRLHAKLAAALVTDADRAAYRAVFAPALRRWSILSANYRTAGIFLFAVLGLPLWYFAFEIVGFSTILLLLLRTQRRRYTLFCAGL
jgi:phosphatidylglycerophosphate synthase